jgi:Peptidase inhibitor family I36
MRARTPGAPLLSSKASAIGWRERKLAIMKLSTNLAVAVAIGSAISGAGVVAAQAYPASCTSGQVCLYDNVGYGTELGWRGTGFHLQDISSGNNDRMSSWSNHTTSDGAWYQNPGGGGYCFTMAHLTSDSNVGALWNDQASSWKGDSSCP